MIIKTQMADYIVKHRFHGRRKGKTLTAYRQSLIDVDFQDYKIHPPSLPPFNNNNETWLEIGFGNGEFLSHMAQTNPNINFIGCEPFINGVAALLSSLKRPVDNLKIWPDDVRILMDEIPDESFDRVYLLNPDPWPKARHEKRRFVQEKTLNEISRVLKPNGLFTMSTDVENLADYMFDKTHDHKSFEWLDNTENDKLTPPVDWPIEKTRYMKKALGGEDIYWLRFKRL